MRMADPSLATDMLLANAVSPGLLPAPGKVRHAPAQCWLHLDRLLGAHLVFHGTSTNGLRYPSSWTGISLKFTSQVTERSTTVSEFLISRKRRRIRPPAFRVHIEATIIAGSGARTDVVFSQNLELRNYFHCCADQVLSRHNAQWRDSTTSYPLTIDAVTPPDDSGSRGGSLNIAPTGNTGSHGISNTVDYYDTAGNTYTRQVNASRNVITFDSQSGDPALNAIANRLIVVSPARADTKARLPGGRSNAITATQAPIWSIHPSSLVVL
ncbi:hypothetical protein EDB89DRAFT_1903264 [Lactarius sanguifluus]|nr:hypothetical protein EDB89DRAFT_1903264 [Lactarius sanguifluus]